jgi:hypothetical protein
VRNGRVGISLIGTPDGFESVSIGASKSINMGRKVDLDNSVINILPNTDILVVRRDFENARLFTYVTFYKFAKEIKTSRTGSFYGASILFENFVPGNTPFVFKLLTLLTNTVNKYCIDPSVNRFNSHIKPTLLQSLVTDNPQFLEASTYQTREIQSEYRIINKRKCFLLLDEIVPDYESFLSKVIYNNAQDKSNLSSYQFIYTSEHQSVVEEARIRRGLEVETLTSLREKYRASRQPVKQRSEANLVSLQEEKPLAEPTQGEVQKNELINKLPHQEPMPANRLLSPATQSQSELELERTDADIEPTDRGTRLIIPISQDKPPDEDEQDQEPPDGRLVAWARATERFFKGNKEARGKRFSKVVFILFFFIIVFYLGSRLLSPLIAQILSLFTGNTDASATTIIYYDGCRNLKGGEETSSNIPLKCQPEQIAREFLSRLKGCKPYDEHLSHLLTVSGQDGILEYNRSIQDQIKSSLADPSLHNKRSNDDIQSLSKTRSTGFAVKLEFTNSRLCIDRILSAPDSDFLNSPIDDTPVVTNNPTPQPARKTEGGTNSRDVTPALPGPISARPPTATPSKSPSKTPIPTPPPITGAMPNNNATEGVSPNKTPPSVPPSVDQNSAPDAVSRPNQNQTRTNNSNKSQPAPMVQGERPKRKRGKRGP